MAGTREARSRSRTAQADTEPRAAQAGNGTLELHDLAGKLMEASRAVEEERDALALEKSDLSKEVTRLERRVSDLQERESNTVAVLERIAGSLADAIKGIGELLSTIGQRSATAHSDTDMEKGIANGKAVAVEGRMNEVSSGMEEKPNAKELAEEIFGKLKARRLGLETATKIIEGILEGKSYNSIGKQLGISDVTVKNYDVRVRELLAERDRGASKTTDSAEVAVTAEATGGEHKMLPFDEMQTKYNSMLRTASEQEQSGNVVEAYKSYSGAYKLVEKAGYELEGILAVEGLIRLGPEALPELIKEGSSRVDALTYMNMHVRILKTFESKENVGTVPELAFNFYMELFPGAKDDKHRLEYGRRALDLNSEYGIEPERSKELAEKLIGILTEKATARTGEGQVRVGDKHRESIAELREKYSIPETA